MDIYVNDYLILRRYNSLKYVLMGDIYAFILHANTKANDYLVTEDAGAWLALMLI